MRLLFVKRSLAWPRATGHDLYTYHTIKACSALGHEVSLAVASEPSGLALEGLALAGYYRLESAGGSGESVAETWLQRRSRSYYGLPRFDLAGLSRAASVSGAEAAIVVGLDTLPYFSALSEVTRVWFAADEIAWRHLSQAQFGKGGVGQLREALFHGLHERAHRRLIDRVWVVSNTDQRAMRWLAGMHTVDVLPLGVDSEYFAPGPEIPEERTAVFWGRLDFGPNIQALEWFCGHVWPIVRSRLPDARFTVIGFYPTDTVRRLVTGPGLRLLSDVADLRSIARRHALAVLPFVSGGGAKNKLLEAAALGLPVICTPFATGGIRSDAATPLVIESTPESFSQRIIELWASPDRRLSIGAALRAWVVANRTWVGTAQAAMATLDATPLGEGRQPAHMEVSH